MSFKLSRLASFFSRASHKVQEDKKTGAPQFVAGTSPKTEKTNSPESSSKISRFFHRLFHSKEKAREGVEAAFYKNNPSTPYSLDVKSKSNPLSIYAVTFNTAAQKYLETIDKIPIVPANPADFKKKLDQSHSYSSNPELDNSEGEDDENIFKQHLPSYTQPDQIRSFIYSDEGRFMFNITNMGSCTANPLQYFKAMPGIDLQKILTTAFQVYYEEGMLVHEDSFATPGWGYEATPQSPENLRDLKADLNKIHAFQQQDHELLQKTIGAIDARITRLNTETQRVRSPS